MNKVKNQQLELFSPNDAESGNTNQLSPVPDAELFTGECNTDDCSFFLPAAGYRNSNGTMNNVGKNGNYWSRTPNGNNGYNLNFNNNGNININNNNRNNGQSVRCVKAFTEGAVPSLPAFTIDSQQLLVDLFKAYYDARKHKRNTRNQLRFEVNLEENLVNLRDELMERTYKVGRSTCFIIEDHVKREIFAADFRDRVVHHLVYNYIMPIFERTFITDSYSCRKGKGTLYGVERLEHHIRSCSHNYTDLAYALKMDIQGYFMNINRKHLLETVKEDLMKYSFRESDTGQCWKDKLDYSLVFFLLEEIILTDPTNNCIIKGKKSDWKGLPDNKSLFKTPSDCGLPIGNLTSQLFSNIYLNRLDQMVKRQLREKHYGRYVDDSYIINRCYATLRMHKETIRRYLHEELGLTLHPKKSKIVRCCYGIDFLGVFVKPHRSYINNRTKKRIFRKSVPLFNCTDTEKLRAGINSYLGYMKHFKCGKIKERLFGGKPQLELLGEFIGHYSKFSLPQPELKRTGS